MRISVVMATYNGERYLLEQLDSILWQTVVPDEVIICDDHSTDSTNRMIDSYIKEHQLEHWVHIKNKENMGWKRNFMKAIRSSNGDIVFTCDQDDIWYPDKLKIMLHVMEGNRDIMLLASDFDLKYQNKNRNYMPNRIKKYKLNQKFLFIMRPGCTYCFRKKLFDSVFPYWFDSYPHDALLWRMANIMDALYLYEDELIYYRRHKNTATGHDRKTIKNKINSMEYYLKSIDGMVHYVNLSDNIKDKKKKLKLLNKSNQWCILRLEFLRSGRLDLWFRLLKYIKYYYNIRSYFADLFMKVFKY